MQNAEGSTSVLPGNNGQCKLRSSPMPRLWSLLLDGAGGFGFAASFFSASRRAHERERGVALLDNEVPRAELQHRAQLRRRLGRRAPGKSSVSDINERYV